MINGNRARLISLILSLGATWSIALFLPHYWPLSLLVSALIISWLIAGTLLPNAQFFGAITSRLSPQTGKMWLTIDDGPHPENTPGLLDLLDQFQVSATFFLIGEQAQAHPEIVKEICRRGHEIGNHSMTHPEKRFWSLLPSATEREIAECQTALASITGQRPRFFRAPVGHSNLFVHPALRSERLRLIGWSARGFDGVGNSERSALRRLIRSMGPGKIVLIHDTAPYALSLTRSLLEHSREMGWEWASPDDSQLSESC